MRPIEIGLALAVAIATGISFVERSRRLALGACIVIFLLLVAQVFGEGARFQAVPIYLGTLLTIVVLLARFPLLLRIGGGFLSCLCVAVGLLACYVFPVIRFPAPGGPYAIGTSIFEFTDSNRQEQYGENAGQKRRMIAQVWYPASKCAGRTAYYRDPRTLIWKSAHLRYVKTHACEDAPFLAPAQKWPVIFFSPSAGGNRNQNTFLVEYLVSHGYMVVGMDHPDTSSRVAFADGTILHSLPDVWLNLSSRAELKKSTVKTENILLTNVKDMQFVYDQLKGASDNSKLGQIASQMDFTRVAAIGHSFGGAAAAELCRTDPRFHIGANMDGWMFSGVNQQGIPKPFLFMIEDDPFWLKKDNGPFDDNEYGMGRLGNAEFYTSIRHSLDLWGGCALRLIGGDHGTFADAAVYQKPWPWQKPSGIDPNTAHLVIREIILAFLDENFKGKQRALQLAALHYTQYVELMCRPTRTAVKSENTAHSD